MVDTGVTQGSKGPAVVSVGYGWCVLIGPDLEDMSVANMFLTPHWIYTRQRLQL
jgi:hypothetical protein